MSDWAIETRQLNKHFGKRVHAVKNIDLKVPRGQVYGFLGHNGAGKTTTIRMLLDLVRPSSGEVFVLGKRVPHERDVLRYVGAQVEDAAFYPFLNGFQNLRVLAQTANLDLPPNRIDELLDFVKIKARAKRVVRGYSTGMKQRLGLAAVLLGDPDLVILDEPTNGLDPQGRLEMREFIRQLADEQGKTVFLSSHLLNEVEQICDRVAIVHQGEIIREGTIDDLIAAETRIKVIATPTETAITRLNAQWTTERDPKADDTLWIQAEREAIPAIVRTLADESIDVYEVLEQKQSLEDYFLTVTTDVA